MKDFEDLSDVELLLELTSPEPDGALIAWAILFRRDLFRRANRILYQLGDPGEFNVQIRD